MPVNLRVYMPKVRTDIFTPETLAHLDSPQAGGESVAGKLSPPALTGAAGFFILAS